MQQIDVRHNLDEAQFVREYARPRKPVIVTGCMESWKARRRWTFPFLSAKFGQLIILTQHSTFRPADVERLGTFIDCLGKYDQESHFGRNDVPYIRTTRLKGVDTDDFPGKVIDELKDDWERPSFLPRNLFVVPKIWREADPTSVRFPSFGLYVSPRGACTSLHLDADLTSAINCQLQGQKRWYVFAPELTEKLPERTPNPTNILTHGTPKFGGVQPTHEFNLLPGQILYLPGNWYHEVYSLEASISLTFNFVHLSEAQAWARTVCKPHNPTSAYTLQSEYAVRSLQYVNIIKQTLVESQKLIHVDDLSRWGMSLQHLSEIERTISQLENSFADYLQ